MICQKCLVDKRFCSHAESTYLLSDWYDSNILTHNIDFYIKSISSESYIPLEIITEEKFREDKKTVEWTNRRLAKIKAEWERMMKRDELLLKSFLSLLFISVLIWLLS